MIANTMSKMRWLHMISVKNCGKIVDGRPCPCADQLRKTVLKLPINSEEQKTNENDILKHQTRYNKCFMEEKYWY